MILTEARLPRRTLSTNFVDANLLNATPLNHGRMQRGPDGRLVGGAGFVGRPRLEVLRHLVHEDHSWAGMVSGGVLLGLGGLNLLLSLGLSVFDGHALTAALAWTGDALVWLADLLWRPPILRHPWVGQGPAAQWAAWLAFSAIVAIALLASVQVLLKLTAASASGRQLRRSTMFFGLVAVGVSLLHLLASWSFGACTFLVDGVLKGMSAGSSLAVQARSDIAC